MTEGEELAEHITDLLAEKAAELPLQPPQPVPVRRKRQRPGDKVLAAARIRTEATSEGSPVSTIAQQCEDAARAPVTPDRVVRGSGGEMVPMGECAEEASLVLIDTLEKPDWVAADASRDRLELLNDAGALSTGLDFAETIQARDASERMLAHQMAALHTSTLKMAAQLSKAAEWSAPIEVVRPLVWLLSLEDGRDGKAPEA